VSPGFSSPTITSLYPYPLSLPSPTCRFLCEAWWTCHSTRRGHTWRQRSDCILATEQLLSVIALPIYSGLDVKVTPIPGWSGGIPNWHGVPCRIGRVEMWLPVQNNLSLRPFSMLALLPKRNVPHALPYVCLGVQFFQEYKARVALDCSNAPGGQLTIP
jgi:hypothetical protein